MEPRNDFPTRITFKTTGEHRYPRAGELYFYLSVGELKGPFIALVDFSPRKTNFPSENFTAYREEKRS